MDAIRNSRKHLLTIALLHINVQLLTSFGFNYSTLQTTRGQCGSIRRLVIFQNKDFFVILSSMIVKNVLKCSLWFHWEPEITRTCHELWCRKVGPRCSTSQIKQFIPKKKKKKSTKTLTKGAAEPDLKNT